MEEEVKVSRVLITTAPISQILKSEQERISFCLEMIHSFEVTQRTRPLSRRYYPRVHTLKLSAGAPQLFNYQ